MKHSITKKIVSALLILGMTLPASPAVLALGDVAPIAEEQNTATTQEETSAKDQDLIELANGLANGTHTSYASPSRNVLNIKNQTMSLDYSLWTGSEMNVNRLSNTKGASYVENTMDVFVKTDDGETYYASKSTVSASMNIYRYGYYYYENRIEGQVFVPEIKAVDSYKINHLNLTSNADIINVSKANDEYSYTINGEDPFVRLENLNISASEYNYAEITVKATEASATSQMFIIAGSQTSFTASQSYTFSMASDGEYHTYHIPLTLLNDYTGVLKGIRFDINGAKGSQVSIKSINLVKAQDLKIDSSLSIQRSFLSYSDKLHHLTQFSATKEFTGIESVGMETRIACNTVNAIVVKDAGGHKDNLADVDWASAEYAGFDIAGTGIFGYILPADDKSGSMEITVEDGYYVLTQTLPVTKFTPSAEKTLNANDIFFGQRIYNDESHDFETFIYEAESERNPLTAKNILVDISEGGAAFEGYDALRGYYQFSIGGTSFNPAYYEHPNRHYNLRFTVIGDDKDRQVYFMSRCSSSGCLESAVLLDESDMLLPIPMEIAKNFSGDGENTIYNIDDAMYGETYFPVIVNEGEARTYNLINLYQNWGQYPLKQISSIQFFQPYYHLSTGVTETNCIVPYPVNSPGLPDFRAMSAPFWTGQPQHNSGGGHSFLRYTDADGLSVSSQNTTASIDSYGPTYCDLTLGYVTSDGKVSATYTHTEMPQLDENRAYYEMKYTFNDDVSFSDFAHNFVFYRVTDNNATGVYEKVGYLDVNNNSQVADAVDVEGQLNEYVLGNECPYFSFFMMPNWNRESTSAQGYTNLAMLFKDWTVISNGEEIDAQLLLINSKDYLTLTMNFDEITFKAGDTITINAILMPWGSQQMEDEPANRLENAQTAIYNSPHYSDVLPDGTLYMDKNVRDVRENTFLNPLTATEGENSTVIVSPFVPKVKSTNGQSATFTVSGGYDNNAVRVYGFQKLTVPKIEQLVDGEWVEYTVSSKSTPDEYGYGHNYDGYMVHYDSDGSYSYSFVFNMTDVESRTFRVTAEEDFVAWEYDSTDIKETPMNVFFDAQSIYQKASSTTFFESRELSDDGSYVTLKIAPNLQETYINLYSAGTNVPSGQYIAYKYRTQSSTSGVEFWISTTNSGAGGSDYITIQASAMQTDGNWHVMIVDVTKLKTAKSVFEQSDNGTYCARYLRVDTSGNLANGGSIDIGYIGISDSIAEIIAASGDVASFDLVGTDKKSYTSINAEDYLSPKNATEIKLESASIHKTNEVELKLSVSNNNGLSFVRVIPKFDPSVFTLKNVESSDILPYSSKLNGSFIFYDNENNTEDGNLATFTFEFIGEVDFGSYEIELVLVDASGKSAGDLTFSAKSSVINVIEHEYGDITGDGIINTFDLIALRKYFANLGADTETTVSDGADVNGDGFVDALDLLEIRKYIAYYDFDKNEPTYPIGRK